MLGLQGMVDAGEVVSVTLKREFGEEALNSLMATDDEKRQIRQSISDLFDRGGAEVNKWSCHLDSVLNDHNGWSLLVLNSPQTSRFILDIPFYLSQ